MFLYLSVSVLEVASGEYGDYTDILSIKSENGLSQDWRKKQRNSIQLEALEHISEYSTNLIEITL